MALKAGLVGLPNVGKSTLFNALTKSAIPAENFPFCTIDPNTAITQVPDARLNKLQQIFGSKKVIPATTQFVDIAGLVKGASKGEGLGNRFLAHIMEVDLIIHVVRCFEDEQIMHVSNRVNPLDDFEDIISELILRDIESAEKRAEKVAALLKGAKTKQLKPQQVKELEQEALLLEELKPLLNNGDYQGIYSKISLYKAKGIRTTELLSAKPFIIAANFSDELFANQGYKSSQLYQELIHKFGEEKIVPVSARIEAELSQLDPEEASLLAQDFGMSESGLDSLIRHTYQCLNLKTFFTCGPQEAHAWTITDNTLIPQAAGTIHSDLERGFIAAEVYNAAELFEAGSEQALKQAGKLRTEGKEYVVRDGDIINVRFNV